MEFEIRHRFEAPVEEVERVMFHEDLPRLLASRVELLRELELLEARRSGSRLERRVRYLPVPMIRKIGTVTVEPEWMEWVEESSYDFSTHRGTFVNVPARRRIAELLSNHGSLRFEPRGGATERVVSGELRVKVFMVGRIAEKVIHGHAAKLLDQEAAAVAALLRDRAL
ncbi:MAG: DUF2505 family protein [Deltaproteobacteria bacterium]|nr:DUF2505 family protein [Deltaproteobacteria bacterium]